jgi:hypothetical protein
MLAGLGGKRDSFVGISIVDINTAVANSHVADRIWLNQSSKLYHYKCTYILYCKRKNTRSLLISSTESNFTKVARRRSNTIKGTQA